MMFAEHQPIIADFAKQSPENTARVIKFVLLTVRRRLEHVAPLMDDDNRRCTSLTLRGIEYAERNAQDLYDDLLDECVSDAQCIERLLQVPGLGMVKAGFVMQLVRGRVGCLDSHNIKMYGLNPRAFASTTSITGLRERVRLYMQVCADLGGVEVLWDRWCDYVATLRPKVWSSGEAVSRAHVDLIVK